MKANKYFTLIVKHVKYVNVRTMHVHAYNYIDWNKLHKRIKAKFHYNYVYFYIPPSRTPPPPFPNKKNH